MIGACLMDIKKATTLASVTVMTFMLSGGFFVKVNSIYPVYCAICMLVVLSYDFSMILSIRNTKKEDMHVRHFIIKMMML